VTWRSELTLPVEVVVSELLLGAARLRDAGQRLQDGLSSVDLETRELLGSGWKGDAASAFGTQWEKWHGGAGQVVRGLQTMSDLLSLAGKEYAKTDEQGAGALGSTMQGAGGTGGSPGSGAVNQSTGQMAQQTPRLADQMNLESLSQVGQVAGQVASGLAQAGQVATGMAQQAAQMASGLAQQVGQAEQHGDGVAEVQDEARKREPREGATRGDPSTTSAPVEPAAPRSSADGAVERPAV
jgi:WXG100 family type VII secretion target